MGYLILGIIILAAILIFGGYIQHIFAISQCEHFLFCKLFVCHNFLQFIFILISI